MDRFLTFRQLYYTADNKFPFQSLPTLFCLLEYNNLYGPQENQIKFYEPTRDAYKFIEMIDNLR